MTQHDETPSEKLNLDRVLIKEVGQCGRFQLKIIALCILLAVMAGQQSDQYLFTFAKVNTRCFIPECENRSQTNFTPPWILNAIPATGDTFDNCHRFEAVSDAISGECSAELFDRNSTVQCQEYVYKHNNSAIFEFNLACDNWRPNLVGTVIAIGDMLSLIVGGFIADRWGRRLAVAFTGFSLASIGSMLYFTNNYLIYLLIGFMSRLLGGSLMGMVFILAIEFVGPKQRVAVAATLNSVVAFGTVSTALTAWSGLYWRHLLLTIHCPLFIALTCYWFFPESIRWLMSNNRYQEAKTALGEAARINGNCLSEKTLQYFQDNTAVEKKEKPETWLVCLVFKHKYILRLCIITCTWWFAIVFVNHGLAITSTSISGNRYINYSAVILSSIPGYWITVTLLNKIGRKPVVIMSFWICGVCQFAYIAIPKGNYWISISIYLMGRLIIAVGKTAITVYISELFPTRHRASLESFSLLVGISAGALTTITPALAETTWVHLPYFTFGCIAILAGFLAFLTPETFGTSMPDTMEDAGDLCRSQDTGIMRALRKLTFRSTSYSVQ